SQRSRDNGFMGGSGSFVALFPGFGGRGFSFRVSCVLAFGMASTAAAQPFSLGVIGGASLTEGFKGNIKRVPPPAPVIAYSTPKRWIAGATVEARLPLHFAIELDALYHELEFTQAAVLPNGTLNSVSPAPVVTWEFPVLAKIRFPLRVVKPFLVAGPAFRTAGNLNGTSPSNHGIAAGLGTEVRFWRLCVAPQFRYLRWARDAKEPPFHASAVTVPDQIQFLTAITS